MRPVSSAVGGRSVPSSSLPAALGLLEAVLTASDDAILHLDAAGRVTGSNQSAERLLGRHVDEIVGLVCTDLFALHERGQVASALDTAMSGHEVRHLETEIHRPDGMPVPISVSVCPVFESVRIPVAALLIGRDITEQRLAQASLAEVEARVRESEALANVGSWLWDLHTDSVQWSDEFHRIHGVDPLDFEGTLEAHLHSIHTDDREHVRTAMEDAVARDRPFEAEYRIVRPDQDERRVHARAQTAIGSAGTVVGLRGIGQDVTDRRGADGAAPG